MPSAFLTCRTDRTPSSGVYRITVTEHPFQVDLSARIVRTFFVEHIRLHPFFSDIDAAARGPWLIYDNDRSTLLSVGWPTLRAVEQAALDIAGGHDPAPSAR
jgi:hypothetical protein